MNSTENATIITPFAPYKLYVVLNNKNISEIIKNKQSKI